MSCARVMSYNGTRTSFDLLVKPHIYSESCSSRSYGFFKLTTRVWVYLWFSNMSYLDVHNVSIFLVFIDVYTTRLGYVKSQLPIVQLLSTLVYG